MRHLRDLPVPEVQHEDVAVTTVAVRHEGEAQAVRREHGITVIVRSEGHLLGPAPFDRQTEQVSQHREDQPLTIRRHSYIGCGDLGGFKFNRARDCRRGSQDEQQRTE